MTILINSIYRSNKTYYPQVLLEGCKFKKKKRKNSKKIIYRLKTKDLYDSNSYSNFDSNSGFESIDWWKMNKKYYFVRFSNIIKAK